MAAKKSSLVDLIVKAVEDSPKSHYAVWAALRREGWTLSKGHFYNMAGKKTNSPSEIPKSGLNALRVVLGLDISADWREVDRHFEVRWAADDSTDVQEVLEFGSGLNLIDKMYGNLDNSSKMLGAWTRQLIGTLDHRHILVSITSGLCPPILEWDDEMDDEKIGDQQRAFRIKALKNRLLWALITPTPAHFENLTKHGIRIDPNERYTQIKEGYERLEKCFATENVQSQMMRFEWREFPLTPYGWTTSLIGWRDDRDNPRLRVIIRSVYQRSLWYQMLPAVTEFEEDVRDFSVHVLRNDLHKTDERAKFVRGLLRRMKL